MGRTIRPPRWRIIKAKNSENFSEFFYINFLVSHFLIGMSYNFKLKYATAIEVNITNNPEEIA